jgi:hypothetical protein
MLLQRKTITDKRTGGLVDAVVLRVCGADGHPKQVTLTGSRAERFDQIDAALRSYGGLFPKPRRGAYDSTDPLAWNISELAHLEARMLKKKRAPTFYKRLIPISTEAPPWATSVVTQVYDEVGVAELSASDSTEMPFADARFDRVVIEVKGGKIGYHYDIQEMIESAQLKHPLPEMRLRAAQNAYDRHMNLVALQGEKRTGQKGLWNQAGVTPVYATTGAWDDPSTSAITIIDELCKPIADVHEATGGNDFVTTIVLPLKLLSALGSRMVTVTSGGVTLPTPLTVLEYVKANNVSKTAGGIDIEFVGIPDDIKADGTTNTAAGSSLSYAGTLSHTGTAKTTSRVVFYVRDEEHILMHIPLPLTFLAPQPRNTDIVMPGRYRYTPPKLFYPKSMYYLDCVMAKDLA